MNLNQQQIHKGYDSDVTDAEWEIVGPLIDTLQSSAKGRPLQHDLRSILNAIFYLSKTGCQWRSLPKDFPHYTVVNYHYNKWRKDGTLETINAVLRQLARKKKSAPRRLRPQSSTARASKVRRSPRSNPALTVAS